MQREFEYLASKSQLVRPIDIFFSLLSTYKYSSVPTISVSEKEETSGFYQISTDFRFEVNSGVSSSKEVDLVSFRSTKG